MGIVGIWRPETFQGKNQRKNYFEGWYFKLIDKQRSTVMAIIPGISIGEKREDAHAFIQVIDAISGKTDYNRFALEDFKADKDKLHLSIGCNEFTDRGLKLDLSSENSVISCELHFTNIVKYPKSIFSPGIMGPFSFVPCMECYHGVVNINHTINGSLNLNGIEIDMTDGEGYIEKDWGHSFPEAWIWLQANHFEEPGVSFMFSVARIPWLGRRFTGLIAFLRIENEFYKFATYNGSKIKFIKFEGDILEATLKSPRYVLAFSAKYAKGGILKAPKNGLMHREIEETITAETTVRLNESNGDVIFHGSSQWAGMEVAGSLEDILQVGIKNGSEN